MESDHWSQTSSNAIGFFLLPSELIQYIILQLALPDIVRLKSVNKAIALIISDQDFVRDYNFQSSSATWLFIYKKRWRRDALLHGYTNRYSDRWFKILIADMLKPVVPPGEDLYLLAASGNVFLFALNNSREVISVNPMNKTIKRIPPSPLGPRGTSSWRRSGMKLLACPLVSHNFRFLFAEMKENGPVLFEYDSRTGQWKSTEAVENGSMEGEGERNNNTAAATIFLSAFNGRSGSVVIAKDPHCDTPPVVLRPRFAGGEDEDARLAVGFSWGNAIDRLHVYGDGNVMIIKSNGVEEGNRRVRMLNSVELWGLGRSGRHWEFISRVPNRLLEKIQKPYGAMTGCLEQRQGNGVVKAILLSNLEAAWDIIWLCYDMITKTWTWLPIPDCKMKGANMAGIAFSSGLTLN